MNELTNSTIHYLLHESDERFRSICVDDTGERLFSIHDDIPHAPLSWCKDILGGDNYRVFKNIFEFQKKYKLEFYNGEEYEVSTYGRLVLSKFTSTLHHSLINYLTKGLFDEDDLPPIDTWVSYEEKDGDIYLLAIIPHDRVDGVNEAIDLEVLDIISWY